MIGDVSNGWGRGALTMLGGALLALLAGCATVPPVKSNDVMQVWASSADASRKLMRLPDIESSNDASSGQAVLTIDTARPDQIVVGYGAAMTDASAQLFAELSPDARKALFKELFGPGGLRLGFVRVPIGASDFSVRHYSLDDMPKGESDPELREFSMAGAAPQIAMLREARQANPALVLMASPWSAPGWMKDSDSLIKGQLRAEYYPAYAEYFARYLDAMERAALPVSYVSVQNEPDFEPADYPGMRFRPADRARFVGQHLGPRLAARTRPVRILEWDHNWDKPEQPLTVLDDPMARAAIAGVAWHCYAGEPSAMARVRTAWPGKEVFFTECSGGEWAPDWGGTLGWMIDNLVIAPSRAGSRGTVLWNLALDQSHGPHLGGCGNCRGVVTIDRTSGAVIRNVEYYVLGHVSRFVLPGAQRVASEGVAGIEHVAFRNPDGTVVLLLHNVGGPADVVIRSAGRQWQVQIPAGEVMTLVWDDGGQGR